MKTITKQEAIEQGLPTPAQLNEARERAAKLGLTVRGRKHFVLDDGKYRHGCGDFDGLMGQIKWREGIERGEPSYIMSPCGAVGTVFMNDKEQTSIHVERDDEDGDITIAGAKYKKTWGSKTDLQTGEHIQFDILEDGSHKETRRFPAEDDEDDEANEEEERDRKECVALNQKVLDGLVRRVKALVEKGDRAAEKAEQFYKAAGIHIKEIKAASNEWETIVREQCGLGRSRAYELMAIADGKTTLERVRATTNERKKVHRAKSESVPERTVVVDVVYADAPGHAVTRIVPEYVDAPVRLPDEAVEVASPSRVDNLRLAVEHTRMAGSYSPEALAAAVLAIAASPPKWHTPPTIEQLENAAAFLMQVAEAMRRTSGGVTPAGAK